ncbi:ATP-dependent DNA helicase RecG [Anaerospora hongkongensis]|uniref:ATP-dependent DNA helicase RecG n=1 Tax=Anaerospora hongkongensis TaxID=244830 RepID=A0A4R1Q0K9_9FIRM|nr:ATP-binding protein [Anaerospora hongkongensis]TCL38873.1 ATP-dependent DNA helicase RecG [Anaerospora hongkongensis]
MVSLSKYNAKLTTDFQLAPGMESQYFDRKSAGIALAKLAEAIVAFANADGGTIAIGIKDKQFEGINSQGNTRINDFIQCGFDKCRPSVKSTYEFADVTKPNGKADQILFLHIEADKERVHETESGEVFLRVGDESKRLNYEQRLSLEYDKGSRLYEDEIIADCRMDDLDVEALTEFGKAVEFAGQEWEQLLYARGFARRSDSGPRITAAGVLLFAQNPTVFLPSARIRFIRYEGSHAEVGTAMDVIKQEYIEGPLTKLLNRAKDIVGAQLRTFTALNPLDGKFISISEYPPFAWQEGVVNAVTHRAYNIHGEDIRIVMFDDRLEILSPGKFPNVVNKNNIREVRYSRNPRIARALTEMGWVRELNEGVKRIYKEMNQYFLDEPVYDEPNQSVLLVLKNNIVTRRKRRTERINALISAEWSSLSADEKRALEMAYSKDRMTTRDLAELLDRSAPYARKILTGLEQRSLLQKTASASTDPQQYYSLVEMATSK